MEINKQHVALLRLLDAQTLGEVVALMLTDADDSSLSAFKFKISDTASAIATPLIAAAKNKAIRSEKNRKAANARWHRVQDTPDGGTNEPHSAAIKPEKTNKEPKEKLPTTAPEIVKKTAAKTKFQKPTIEEVRSYINESGFRVNADRWYDHYTSNGWMVGRAAMRDWRAAVRTWQRRGCYYDNDVGSSRRAAGGDDWSCADGMHF